MFVDFFLRVCWLWCVFCFCVCRFCGLVADGRHVLLLAVAGFVGLRVCWLWVCWFCGVVCLLVFCVFAGFGVYFAFVFAGFVAVLLVVDMFFLLLAVAFLFCCPLHAFSVTLFLLFPASLPSCSAFISFCSLLS